ncbi:MAG: NADH-quinone oxidoreductase subunit NuoF [Candidatus Cloacimonetes bacterium]|nr:NADH-quinone oxidoreductase subunit NuoF [Candidatus Cloacimonadota bacterium]
MKFYRSHILIGIDDASLAAGVKEIEALLRNELQKNNLSDEINILETGTLGHFGTGVSMLVYPEQVTYVNLKKEDIFEIVEEHFLKGRPLQRLILDRSLTQNYDFNYKRRIVLSNSGVIDPENIDEYLGAGGYEAWEKALTTMKPNELVDEVKASGLKGRGGAGFPAGLKWSFTAPIVADQKYVVVNADEGEPGTFKDRLIMEGDPHKLLEGVMLCAYAIGASKAYIYIRGEYKLCIHRLEIAIAAAREYGILGNNIFGSGFDLDIFIKVGAGAYVCGEETALIESMEGNRGTPRSKPPFPGVAGAWQKPTVVNNVETLANIPAIIKNGAKWFAAHGVDGSTGTKVYTIMGDVNLPGLCEVDMGTSLRTIIQQYAGGMIEGRTFKAALVGGAAGVFLNDTLLDVHMDYNSLREYAAVLGSGAILVMSDTVDMVDMLWSVLRFFRHESCGKCNPCSKGTALLFKLIDGIRKGKGKDSDLEQLIKVSNGMQKTSFCALGQSPCMPIASAINNFRQDFLTRINVK